MMKKFLFFMLFSVLSWAQIPKGYYDGTSGLTGYALKSKLHEIISNNSISLHYTDLKETMATVDVDNYYDKDGSLLDFYTTFPLGGSTYKYHVDDLISTASAEGLGYNREHVMPQSTFYSDYPMYSDMFYIFPSDAYINQRRSNNPYGLVGAAAYTFTNGTKIGQSVTPGKSGTVIEPIDEFKGDIARMLLYFVVRYEGKLNFFAYDKAPNPLQGKEEIGFEQWYIDQLVLWANADPVSQAEKDRNDKVYAFQKNRNPFIDHPEWVNDIWRSTRNTSLPAQPTNLSTVAVGAHFIRLQWTPLVGALGYKILLNGNPVATTSENRYDVGQLRANQSYDIAVSAYNDIYSESSSASLKVTTLDSDDYSQDLMFTKYIEGSNYNKALEITNNTGYDVDLKKYRIAKQALGYKNNGDSYYYTTGSYQLEGILKMGETFVLVNNNAQFSNYDLKNAQVVTNADPLNFSGWQYIELNYDDTKETGKKYPKTIDAIGYFGKNDDYGKDISLYRNEDVKNPNRYFTLSEWTSYPQDYAEHLGGGSLASKEVAIQNGLQVYPNPVTSGILHLKGKSLQKIETLKIFTINGHLVKSISMPFITGGNTVDVHFLVPGTYVLQIDQYSIKFVKG